MAISQLRRPHPSISIFPTALMCTAHYGSSGFGAILLASRILQQNQACKQSFSAQVHQASRSSCSWGGYMGRVQPA